MNKKRRISFACALILSLQTSVLAKLQLDFEDTYFLNVSYTAEDVFSKATIQVLDEQKEIPLYVGESKAVTYQPEEGYTVNFKRLKLNERLLDGSYKIKVGVGGSTEEESFDFQNEPAKIRAIERLKGAETELEFQSYMEEDDVFLGIDTEKFRALEADKIKVCNALFSNIAWEEGAVTAENLSAQQAILNAELERQYEILSLANANDKISEAVDGLEIITVDRTYYDKMKNKSELSEIYASYQLHKKEILKLSEIQKEFDGACLCAVVATCDFKTAERALFYYAEKGIITTPDTAKYDSLSELNQSKVFDELADKNISDYRLLADAFETISKNIYNDSKKKPTQSGGSSGGGGGGGFVMISKPDDAEETTEKAEIITPSVSENKHTFPDTAIVPWAEEAIVSLAKKGAIAGDENGYFCPNDSITREAFVKIAITAFNRFDANASCDFADTDKQAWYYPFVASGVQAGIISGISDSSFGVGKNITREDAAVILYRLYHQNSDLSLLNFKDNDDISVYAKEAVSALSSIGVIHGMEDGKFYPQKSLTRAEAAVLIARLQSLV